MDTELAILKLLDETCRKMSLSDYGEITWQHGQQIRSIVLRGERGDSNVWSEFLDMVREDSKLASGFRLILANSASSGTRFIMNGKWSPFQAE